jgi:hypothetical protein
LTEASNCIQLFPIARAVIAPDAPELDAVRAVWSPVIDKRKERRHEP